MQLSIIVATKNSANIIASCLDSIASAFSNSSPLAGEIIVVDNGSDDGTSATIKKWADTCTFPVRLLFEPRKGKSASLNCALGGTCLRSLTMIVV
jgi:glycosyltransferase involved in cell wall biosynthesis